VDNTNKEFLDTLTNGFTLYKYNITQDQIDKLVLFNTLVMETNEHTNLTSIKDGAESAKKHFLDSLNPPAMELVKKAKSVIDVGSGAGFPGIPLAIVNSNVKFTLIDTRKKRCEFMEHAKDQLKLYNVSVIWKRAEELGRDESYRDRFDIACARALAATPTLLEYLVPFVKVGGYTMLYKGKSLTDELNQAKSAINILGIDDFKISPYTIFDESSQFNMVYAEKIRPTPTKFPRKVGMPTKRPL